MTTKKEYRTTDFVLTISLLSLGFKVIKLEKIGSGKITFVFNPSEALSETIDAFWQDELSINPKTFFNCQKELKARMYSSE